jgi:hypothetical protein
MNTKFQKHIMDLVWTTNFGLNFVEIENSKAHYGLGSNFVKRRGCNSWELKGYGSWNFKTQCNKKENQEIHQIFWVHSYCCTKLTWLRSTHSRQMPQNHRLKLLEVNHQRPIFAIITTKRNLNWKLKLKTLMLNAHDQFWSMHVIN